MENWADGEKSLTHSGMTARFGSSLPEKAENSVRTPAIFSNPSDCCSPLTSKVFFFCFICIFSFVFLFQLSIWISLITGLSVLCVPGFVVI